jgi:hypothetical protein
MWRRELLLGLTGGNIAPLSGRAQQKAMPVVGYLYLGRARSRVYCRVLPGTKRNRLCQGKKTGDRIPLGGGPL